MNKNYLSFGLLTSCLLTFSFSLFSQLKIGDNPGVINSSAVLEIESNSKGLLLSRMSKANRDAIVNPANGLLIFNTESNSFETYKSVCSCWKKIFDVNNNTTTNEAPIVNNVRYSGSPEIGKVLTGNYNYSDFENDVEGSSIIKWYRASSPSGLGAVEISGATSNTYTVQSSDIGKYIGFSVTPIATSGTPIGELLIYYNSTIVLGNATFNFSLTPIIQSGTYTASHVMNNLNFIQIEIDVKTPGNITFTSNTINGYSFPSYSETFQYVGLNWVTLFPTGTQISTNGSGDDFLITANGQVIRTKNINISNQ